MKSTTELSQEHLKLLQHAESLALNLDSAIQSGNITKESVNKCQSNLDKMAKTLIVDGTSIVGEKAYILYEIQALLHWINDDENKAFEFINVAVDTKGDDELYTESANDILGIIKNETKEDENIMIKKSPDKQNEKLIGVHGWLALVSAGIIISALIAVYNIYVLFSVASQLSGSGYEWVVPFEAILNIIIIVLSILYVIYLNKLSTVAKILAIATFAFWVIFSLIDASILNGMYTSTGQSPPSNVWGDTARPIIVACIWIPYFIYSKRVKLTLTK